MTHVSARTLRRGCFPCLHFGKYLGSRRWHTRCFAQGMGTMRQWATELVTPVPPDDRDAEELRPSGMQRVARPRAEVVEIHQSERPTVPAPRCDRPSNAPNPYAQLLRRTPSAAGSSPTHRAASSSRGRGRTRPHTTCSSDWIPPPSAVPHLLQSELRAAPIDNSRAFVLSLIDGRTSIESHHRRVPDRNAPGFAHADRALIARAYRPPSVGARHHAGWC